MRWFCQDERVQIFCDRVDPIIRHYNNLILCVATKYFKHSVFIFTSWQGVGHDVDPMMISASNLNNKKLQITTSSTTLNPPHTLLVYPTRLRRSGHECCPSCSK
mmetsp:Transcript_32756/g.79297  ORF Transcript_32756/g.79297 Transcript_32756/m.79297 type:complete len:104 (+) Transcript_32756:195-506(+)